MTSDIGCKSTITKVDKEKEYVGLIKTMNCGYDAKIIAYHNRKDITLLFEDGCVKEHCRIDKWKTGSIAHPQKLTKKRI